MKCARRTGRNKGELCWANLGTAWQLLQLRRDPVGLWRLDTRSPGLRRPAWNYRGPGQRRRGVGPLPCIDSATEYYVPTLGMDDALG